MRILLGTLVIWLASAASTMAATKYALSGVPITLFQASSTNPDCSATAYQPYALHKILSTGG